MSKNPDAFVRLINALKSCLMSARNPLNAWLTSFYSINAKKQELVDALQFALKQVQHCRMCNTFCEGDLWKFARTKKREKAA